MSNGEEGAAVPTAQKASWGAFLKSIMAASGDLSSMTAPSFILSPVSLAEFPAYWGEPADKFAAIADGKTPEERQLLVTRWFLSTLAGQFTRREKETGSEKKPLNPVLGEQFVGEWNGGELTLKAEQVSHHPPVTAYLLENAAKKITLEGHCAQKTSFSARMITVKQVGHAILRLVLSSGETETYLITLPKLTILGLLLGSPYVELAETSYIQASHGLTTTIAYKAKGYFSGHAHSFTATIGNGPSPSSPLYTIDGVWTGVSTYSKQSKAHVGDVFLDASPEHSTTKPITVKSIDQQNEFESRRVWKDVATGIKSGDFEAASIAKSALENSERQKRKDEAAAGTPFVTRLFTRQAHSSEYETLATLCKHKPAVEDHYTFTGAVGQKAH